MEFIADLHIHSKFSRATSIDMTIPRIAEYAHKKGIKLVGTGDFTHPEWLKNLKAKLLKEEKGLYIFENIYFILTTEVNNIYTKRGRLRRIHNMILTPSFTDAEKINRFLSRYGNLSSDGRPTLNLDAKVMLENLLEISPDSMVIPSHIWTPWFSLFGSHSGFDSVEECFNELSSNLFALETGLSSDPKMNWRLSSLDNYLLISNSDAHSPSRLGREANIFNCALSYFEIREVLKNKDRNRFLATIEFFPEEGKYHYDGHRNCHIRLAPKQSLLNNDLCPVCGRRLTIGVLHRVEALADREEGFVPTNAIPYKNLIPLEEILAEVFQVSRETVLVKRKYEELVKSFENEFNLLLKVPIEEIEKFDNRCAEAIERMRQGRIKLEPGYDGVFGMIKIFGPEETEETKRVKEPQQLGLF